MITTQHAHYDLGIAPIRAFSSITREQADTTARAVHASGRTWHIQAFDDYNGYLSMLIEPSANTAEQRTFFVSGTAQRLDLFQINEDEPLLSIASFSDATTLSTALLNLINQ